MLRPDLRLLRLFRHSRNGGLRGQRILLEGASKQAKDRLVKAANRPLPIFGEHAMGRAEEGARAAESGRAPAPPRRRD